MIMRTKRATRYNSQPEHNQFGIYNWFRLKGITNKEVIYETLHNFCEAYGYDMTGFNLPKQERSVFNWVANRFQKFAPYAGKFLQENNYVPMSHSKV
jgi:hypothetical protein